MVEIGVVCLAGSGNVECRAVIHRAAVYRQADRDVHGGVERDQLDRDVALVVILRDHQIESAIVGAMINGVGGHRSNYIDALLAGALDGGRDELVILRAEQAASRRNAD